MKKLLEFCSRLRELGAPYTIEHNHDDALMVIIASPSDRWEVKFNLDGSIEGENFVSQGFM